MKFNVPAGLSGLLLWLGCILLALAMLVHFDISPLVLALYLFIVGILGLTGH